jgi:hypothetical protein
VTANPARAAGKRVCAYLPRCYRTNRNIATTGCCRRLVVLMGSGNVRGRRFSLGAGVTFALAAVKGVAGERLTSHITPALVVFVSVVAAGMTVTYWVDRRRGIAVDTPERAVPGTPGMTPADSGRGSVQIVIADGPGGSAIATMHGNTHIHGPEDRAAPELRGHVPDDMDGAW